MPGRRLIFAIAACVALLGAAAAEEPKLGDNGLYVQPWFLASFLDLRDDHGEAAQKGKRLVVFWEQRDCPYCKDTHLVNLAKPEIRDYIQKHFEVVQLDIRGARKVKDFDGQELAEKELAQKYGVRFTPTIQYFPLAIGDGRVAGNKLEVARMPGYLRPFPFYVMFQFVQEEAHKTTGFREFLNQRHDESVRRGGTAHTW